MMQADVRDMMLEAAAKVQTVMMEFQKRVSAPQVKSQIAKLWMDLPDELKQKFADEKPQEYAALMKELRGE